MAGWPTPFVQTKGPKIADCYHGCALANEYIPRQQRSGLSLTKRGYGYRHQAKIVSI